MARTNNVFISHNSKDDSSVQALKKRLNEAGYSIRNYSVDSTKYRRERPSDKVIARFLRRQISWAGTFICLIGDKTHTREWVNYEIRQAHLQGKRIVGIFKYGSRDSSELPEAFQKYGGPTLGWNSIDRLGEIIEEKEFPTEDPDGKQRKPLYSPPRVSCNT